MPLCTVDGTSAMENDVVMVMRIMKFRLLIVACIFAYCDMPVVSTLFAERDFTDYLCGGTYNTLNGTIISPNLTQSRQRNTVCTWRITVPEGNIATLQVPERNIQPGTPCRHHVYVYDVSGQQNPLGVFSCTTSSATVITAASNSMLVKFSAPKVTDSDYDAADDPRFHAEWRAVRMPCNPGWILSKFSNNEVKFCIKVALFDAEDDRSYDMADKICAEYGAHLVTITSEEQESLLINSLESNNQYSIGLMRNGTNPWTWVTDEPYNYTRIITGIPTSNHAYCASIILASFAGLYQYVNWYAVRCSGSTIPIRGYVCEHEISDGDQCGGFHTTDSGTISSANYPPVNNVMERCEWKITALQDSVILLVFTHLDIARNQNCKYDYVKVSEGKKPRQILLGTYCGSVAPVPLGSSVNTVWIAFRSSQLSARTGFQLSWATDSCTYNCKRQKREEDSSGSIDPCQLTCEKQNTRLNNNFVCKQGCTANANFDRDQCGLATEADHPCCTPLQCNFTIPLSDAVTENAMTELSTGHRNTSDLMIEHETPGVLTQRDSMYQNSGFTVIISATIPILSTILIACGILMWKFRRRQRQIGKQSKTSCLCVTIPRWRHVQTPQNGPVFSPILQTILEREVQLKLQPLLMRDDVLQLGEQLGRGAFGIVLKGTYTPHSDPPKVLTVAIKTLSDNCIGSEISAFVDEAITMAEFNHIHVLSVIGVCINRKTEVPMIVLPFMEHSDLRTYLRQFRRPQCGVDPPDETQLLLFCLHIARGMTYLSGLKFIHRDLAARNCPVFSPILQTILEREVQLKLQPLLMRDDVLQLGEQLGRGAFGIVLKGTYTPHSDPPKVLTVAIKTLSDNCIGSEISAFVDEAITMAEFNHIHVLSVIGVCINRKTEVPMIVLPFMEHSDLRTYLRQFRRPQCGVDPPDETQLLLFCLHIARGMTYLSGLKFIHRDLAARNCMLDGNRIVKVADFGLSKDVYTQAYYRQEHQKMLPIKWMALESLQDQVYTLYTDIWSYGVTVWEVMSLGKVPYTELDNSMVLGYLETGARLPRPKTCPDFLYALMKNCWKEYTDHRPTFAQISNQISDYLSEKCEYLDLNLESDANLHAEGDDASNKTNTSNSNNSNQRLQITAISASEKPIQQHFDPDPDILF